MPKKNRKYVEAVVSAILDGEQPNQKDLTKALYSETVVFEKLRFCRDRMLDTITEIVTNKRLAPREFMKMLNWAQHACERHELLHDGMFSDKVIQVGYAMELPPRREAPKIPSIDA